MADFCTQCGAMTSPGQKFCGMCGAGLSPPAEKRESRHSPAVPHFETPPPPPARPQLRVAAGKSGPVFPEGPAPGPGALPPASARPGQDISGLQDKTTRAAEQILGQLVGSGLNVDHGPGRVFSRMVRAALLDKELYRQVSREPALDREAWTVVLVVIAVSSVPGLVQNGPLAMLSSALVQLISWLAWVWVVQIGARTGLKRTSGFGQVLRPLAYAQAPGVLQAIPIIQFGLIISLWRFITSMVAIKDGLGVPLVPAAVLALVGWLVSLTTTYFAWPLVSQLLG